MSSLLSLEGVLSEMEDADNFIVVNEPLRRFGLIGVLGDCPRGQF